MIFGMKTIILASESPRRKEILSFFNLPFEVAPSGFDEDNEEILSDPVEYAGKLALGKVQTVAPRYPDYLVLGADTVVFQEGKYFGKPKNLEEAKEFLKTFSNTWQTVVTAMALFDGKNFHRDHEVTRLKMARLEDHEIDNYLNLNLWQDKAGGYTAVGPSALLIEQLEGCFYNVLGLPINPLKRLLKAGGIDLWDHL